MKQGIHSIICAIRKAYDNNMVSEANKAVAYGIENYDLEQATMLWLAFSKHNKEEK